MAERQYTRREIFPILATLAVRSFEMTSAITLASKLLLTPNTDPAESAFYNLSDLFDLQNRTSAELMMTKTRGLMNIVAEGRVPDFVKKISFKFEENAHFPYKIEYSEGVFSELDRNSKPQVSNLARFRELRDYFENDYPNEAPRDGEDFKVQVVFRPEPIVPQRDLADFPYVELVDQDLEIVCHRMTTIKVDRIYQSRTQASQSVEDKIYCVDSTLQADFKIDKNTPIYAAISLTRTRILPTRKERKGKRDLMPMFQVRWSTGARTKFITDKGLVEQGYKSVVNMYHSRWG